MFRHIMTPRYPELDTTLARAVGAVLAGNTESLADAREQGALPVDLIIMAPYHREMMEIMWYPHSSSWALLQLGAPLLFWPTQMDYMTSLATSQPQIAVALDGHTHAERAIPFACALAESLHGEVVLLRVIPACPSERRSERLRHAHEVWTYLHGVREAAVERTTAPVTTKVMLGEPGTALVDFVRRRHSGMIVMTTHSQERGGRYFAGAVATHVVRESPAPILLIPLGAETTPRQRRARHRTPVSQRCL